MLVAVLVASLCLVPPVPGPIVEPFVEPACQFCAGHRTVDIALGPDRRVVAPVSGRVVFAGEVAGRRFVSIRSGEYTVTLGGFEVMTTAAGAPVRSGDPIGWGTRGQPIALSLRISAGGPDERYLDPGRSLAHRVGRARLVPLDGTRPRPTSTRLVCPAGR